MGILSDIGDGANWVLDKDAQIGNWALDKVGMGKKKFPHMGANPYQSGWDSLIGQLQDRAAGKNSLAEAQVRDVAAKGMNQQMAMSNGRSAGAAREASLAGSQITQGLENSAGQARLAESMQSQQALQNALGGAGQAQFERDNANHQADMQAAAQPSGFEKFLSVGGQLAAAASGAGAFKAATPEGPMSQQQWMGQPAYQGSNAPGSQDQNMMRAPRPQQDPFASNVQGYFNQNRTPQPQDPYNAPGQRVNQYGARY